MSRLRQGGMTEVWAARLAEEVGPGRPLVIKILPHSMEKMREAEARFLEEARIVLNLTHGNIATAFEFGREDERPFLVMEYVPGPSLKSLLASLREKGELMKTADAVFIAREVARALSYAHSFSTTEGKGGIVHRDISPDNILISTAGQVKLTDFGIATFMDSGLLSSVWGKAAYIAPEVAKGGPAGPQSDLYGLGAVFYECLAGVPPIRGEDDGETLKLILSAEPKPLAEYRQDIPVSIERFAADLLNKDPAQRPASASQAELSLRSLLGEAHSSYTETVLAKTIARHFKKGEFFDENAGDRLRAGLLSAGMELEGKWTTAELLATRTVPLGEGPEKEVVEKKVVEKKRATRLFVLAATAIVLGFAAVLALMPGNGEKAVESVAATDRGFQTNAESSPVSVESPQKEEPPLTVEQRPGDGEETPSPAKAVSAVKRRASKGDKEKEPSDKEVEFGWLNINSHPWSYVSVDGDRLDGHTPYRKIKVKSGHHKLVFENPQLEIKTTQDVQVKAWEEMNVGVRLE
jgi:hypothetical protein